MEEKLWRLRPVNAVPESDGQLYDRVLGLARIKGGQVVFAEVPEAPPWELLELVRTGIADRHRRLGPPTNSASILDRLNSKLIVNGLRQSLVDGFSVRWEQAQTGLRWLVCEALSGCRRPLNLFAQMRWLLESVGREPFPHPRLTSPSASVLASPISAFQLDCLAAQMPSQEWRHYLADFYRLEGQLAEVIVDAIEEGRVLVTREQIGVSVLVPPTLARLRREDEFDDSFHFMLAADLSPGWLEKERPLEATRRKATAWVEELASDVHALGRRFSQASAIEAVMKKFGIPENAARDAARSAKVPWGWKTGRPTKREIFTSHDLKRLIETKGKSLPPE